MNRFCLLSICVHCDADLGRPRRSAGTLPYGGRLPSIAGLECVLTLSPTERNVLVQDSTTDDPHQFRTNNNSLEAQRTWSNSTKSAGNLTAATIIPPLLTVWLRVRVLPDPPRISLAHLLLVALNATIAPETAPDTSIFRSGALRARQLFDCGSRKLSEGQVDAVPDKDVRYLRNSSLH